MTIFVSVPAYCDPDLKRTVFTALKYADHPENIFIGVVQQCDKRQKVNFDSPQVRSMWMPKEDARGVGLARSLALQMYENEEFYLQVDSHMIFPQSWDTKARRSYILARDVAKTDKVCINQWPRRFDFKNGTVHFLQGEPPMKNVVQVGNRNLVHPVKYKFDDVHSDMPEESTCMNAGYIFAPGSYTVEVPPDPAISFWGEEMITSMRAWTRGWRFYAPKLWLSAHRYKRGGKVHRIQDQKQLYAKLSEVSHDKQLDIWTEKDMGSIFGSPQKGAVAKYSKFVGLDLKEEYIKRHLYFNKHERIR
jgi:hypothetical protein